MPQSVTPDKLSRYRQGDTPLPDRSRLWPLYGAGFESLGRQGQPIEAPTPRCGPDELLVRHDACGICFSDIKVIKAGEDHPRIFRDMKKDPVVLGHEVSMTVVGVGDNLRDQYKIGDRFIVQAAVNYPLTVYGKGGQTRGYLDLRDTLQCVKLSLENPAKKGELRIFNQFVETFSVNELAEKIQIVGKQFNLDVQIKSLPNPRKEAENHYYNPAHTGLLDLGLKPHYLADDVLAQLMETVLRYRDNVKESSIFRGVKWK